MKSKTFVISLASAVERRNNIIRQLDDLGMSYELIDAIEGRNISPENNPDIDWLWALENKRWLPKGLLGCSLSHLAAYKKVVEQDLDFGLVLEDDTIISEKTVEFIKHAGDHLLKEEVLLLYYASFEKCLLKKVTDIPRLSVCIAKPVNPLQILSGNAYIITRKACESIIRYQTPLKNTSDSWGVYINDHALKNLRCIYPMLADVADFKSTIDYISDSHIRGKFTTVIEKTKIFPFFHMMRALRKYKRKRKLNFQIIE
jgi:glycosyl transferase, family 25